MRPACGHAARSRLPTTATVRGRSRTIPGTNAHPEEAWPSVPNQRELEAASPHLHTPATTRALSQLLGEWRRLDPRIVGSPTGRSPSASSGRGSLKRSILDRGPQARRPDGPPGVRANTAALGRHTVGSTSAGRLLRALVAAVNRSAASLGVPTSRPTKPRDHRAAAGPPAEGCRGARQR